MLCVFCNIPSVLIIFIHACPCKKSSDSDNCPKFSTLLSSKVRALISRRVFQRMFCANQEHVVARLLVWPLPEPPPRRGCTVGHELELQVNKREGCKQVAKKQNYIGEIKTSLTLMRLHVVFLVSQRKPIASSF